MKHSFLRQSSVLFFLLVFIAVSSSAQSQLQEVTINWDKVIRVSQTIPSLQVVVNPPMRRGSAIHDNVFQSLRDLGADYVRYVPWYPYPKLAIPELDPPSAGKTSWDFSLIDPMTIDFLEATKGHPVVLNFSTVPQWMYKVEKPVPYPQDPDKPIWDYVQGTELRDPSMKEIGDYYGRLFSWYTNGGFTDEAGKRHDSGYHYSIPMWEVLNEVDFEHDTKADTYTRMYDSIVESIRKVKPETKFMGMSLGAPHEVPAFFEYFLDPKNHKPGIPLDYISYHFYAIPAPDHGPEIQEHTFFAQADGFLKGVGYVELIRKRLSPSTRTAINEVGSISADDVKMVYEKKDIPDPIPNSYWNLTSAMFAYVFAELSKMGIEVVNMSQLVGYPTQFPSVSMVDWTTGKPNTRYRMLQLLKDNFGPGDRIVETKVGKIPHIYSYASALITKDGKRRVLLINKRNRKIEVSVPGAKGGEQVYVDQTTAFNPPATSKLTSDIVPLNGLAVAVVTLP
jgi:hypothetical protein